MYAGMVLVVDYDSYQVVHSMAHCVVFVFLSVCVYHCEQSEVHACSSVQSLTESQLTTAHLSMHVPPTVHNDIHVQQGTRQPPIS